MNNNVRMWAAAAAGSGIAAISVSYLLGSAETRERIHFAFPFVLIGTIGIIKLLSEKKQEEQTFITH